MKRTFNYTGRKRIPHASAAIRLNSPRSAGEATSFSVHFGDLMSLGLPPNAPIYVEPYVGSSSMRFAFGTVEQPAAPASTLLDEVDAGGRVLFRIKIVDETGEVGRILASLDELAPRDETDQDGRKPLLPLRRIDLGEELWQLNILESDGPELLVNNRVPDLADRIKSDPAIQGLVIPAALRQVVQALFSDHDDGVWVNDWRSFVDGLHGEEIDWDAERDEDDDEVRLVVESIVKKFTGNHRYASRLVEQRGASNA